MPCQLHCGSDERSARRILIAGIGNIFFGDDAFGCEVAAELSKRSWPEGVKIVDFGIRGYDLAYAIIDGYDAIILIDAVPRGEKPGTVYLLELDAAKAEIGEREFADAHDLTPARVLQLVRALGGEPKNLYLIGCEPTEIDKDGGAMGLTSEVRSAVPRAIQEIESLVTALLQSVATEKTKSFSKPAVTAEP
jgi:hydrogenase maturation protease